jgi:hypothetical protein
MRGISGWFWVIGGLLAAALFMVIAFQFLGSLSDQTLKQNAITTYGNTASWIKTVCYSERDYTITKKVTIPQVVVAIYSADSEKKPPVKVDQKIIEGTMSNGTYFCMQFEPVNDEEPRCQKIDCAVNMTYIGSLPENMDVFAMVTKIFGGRPNFTYSLKIIKTTHDTVTIIGSREEEI